MREAGTTTWPRSSRLAVLPQSILRVRPGIVVAAALAALVLILLWPSLVGGKVFSSGDNILLWPPFSSLRPAGWAHPSNFNLTDPVLGFLPDLRQTRTHVANATPPLWNPYAAAGRPLLASQVYAPLFPLTWLAYVLPFWSSLGWIAAGKLLLAGAGMYLLCRELKLRPGAALLGAIAYPFGTYFIAWLEHPQTNVWAVLPWMFFATRRVCGRGSLGATALLGASTGLACLGGHPESAGFLLAATGAYAAFELIAERIRGPASAQRPTGLHWTESLAGRAALITVGLLLGLGVAAITFLPLAELLGQSGPVQRSWPGLPFKLGWAFFFPELWGNPSKAFASGPVNFNERTAYIGALPLLLAAGSIGRRRPREQWFFVAMLVIALATVFNTPLWAEGVRNLPEGKVAALHRLLIIVSFSGTVLAAFGLQRWLTASHGERRRMLAIMGTTALIPVAAWLARHPSALENLGPALSQLPAVRSGETRAGVVALGSVWRWVLLCSIGLGGLALLLRRASPGLAVGLAVGLFGIDLVTLNYGFHGQLKRPLVDPPLPAAIRYLQQTQGQQRTVASGIELPSNLAERYDLRDARVAIDIPNPSRYADLWDDLGGTGGDQESFHADDRAAHRLADTFAVRHVLLSPAESVPQWLHPVFRSSGGVVAVNPTALPRAWVAYDWRRASSRRADLVQTVGSSTARLRDQPVIETAAQPPSSRAPAVTSAVVADNGPEGVTVDAVAHRPGYVILDDSAYPGWKAYLDGPQTRWYSANENFRAVAVPAGRHVIRFRYSPASALNGAIVSGFCVLVLLGIAVVGAMAQHPREPRRDRARNNESVRRTGG